MPNKSRFSPSRKQGIINCRHPLNNATRVNSWTGKTKATTDSRKLSSRAFAVEIRQVLKPETIRFKCFPIFQLHYYYYCYHHHHRPTNGSLVGPFAIHSHDDHHPTPPSNTGSKHTELTLLACLLTCLVPVND